MIKNIFYFFGFWFIPFEIIISIGLALIFYNIKILFPNIILLSNEKLIISIIIPSTLWLFFILRNFILLIFQGKRVFIPLKKTNSSIDKLNTMYPSIPDMYLSRHPRELCVGMFNNKYVCLPMATKSVTHKLILGSPGSGKSTTLLNPLIYNFNFAPKEKKATFFLYDIKPELTFKSMDESEDYIHIINPSKFDGWGWDVWYGLNESNNDDELLERSDIIARALIVCTNDKNQFFYTSAQTLFKAVVVYGKLCGKGFVDSVLQIMYTPLQDLIAEIILDEDLRKTHPKIIGLVQSYDGKDSKAMDDIELTLKLELSIFMKDSIKYQFDDNPNKATPLDLIKDISISLAIPDHLLKEYAAIFRLITQMTLKCLSALSEEQRSKDDAKLIILLIDEFASIGRLDDIIDGLARLRSRKVSIWLAVQSISQMNQIYGKEGATSIINCTDSTLVFSCKDLETTKMISEWCGTYNEKKTSKTRKAKNMFSGADSINEGQEHQNVMDTCDIMELRKNNQILVFENGNRILADKCPYYMISTYNNKSMELQQLNQIKL